MKRDDRITQRLLLDAGLEVPVEAIAAWSDEQVRAAESWAVVSGIAARSRVLDPGPAPAFLDPWRAQR